PRPGEHEQFIAPLWKQGVGSTIHCVAGDATGIILAAVITASLGLPMWLDLIIEYLAGFAFGLFVFQALFMRAVMGGSYLENVRRSFVPELISMNAMMAAMAPVMSFLMMGRDMRAMEPWEPLFWFVMSLGVIAGFAAAYPFNVWLVLKQLKHGLMTERRVPTEQGSTGGAKMGAAAGDHGGHAMAGMDMGQGAAPEAAGPAAAMPAGSSQPGSAGGAKKGAPAEGHGGQAMAGMDMGEGAAPMAGGADAVPAGFGQHG